MLELDRYIRTLVSPKAGKSLLSETYQSIRSLDSGSSEGAFVSVEKTKDPCIGKMPNAVLSIQWLLRTGRGRNALREPGEGPCLLISPQLPRAAPGNKR